jgi:hypothetical protein
MLDVLRCTRDGRLAVVELKADEDTHLPLQGLDYWSRVEWHHSRGEFPRFGYFPGLELSSEKPLLYWVAPALHVHPATDILLRHLSPEIDWEFVGIDERWREGVKVVFRKRPEHGTKRGSELLNRAAS